MDLFSNMNLEILTKALDAASLRNDVISNNIANINTPNYTSRAVAFEDIMKDYIAQAENNNGCQLASYNGGMILNDLASIQPAVYSTGGKVNINTEMSNLAKNQIWYQTIVSQGIGKMFSRLNTVLSMFQG
ncbi:MAG: flagellar basal body rod protein FlgB [Armatimonadota bacterium]